MLPFPHWSPESTPSQAAQSTPHRSRFATSRPFVDVSGSVPLPKPLKVFPPFHEMLMAVRSLAADPLCKDSSGFSQSSASEILTAARHLPQSVTVSATAEISSALLLAGPSPAEERIISVGDEFETLRRVIETVAQGLGLRRVSPNEQAEPSAAETTWSDTPSPRLGHLLPVWAEASPCCKLTIGELADATGIRAKIESFLHDGLFALSTESGIRQAAEMLKHLLQSDTALRLSTLCQANLLRTNTVNSIGGDEGTVPVLAKRLGQLLQSLEGLLRAALRTSTSPATLATTLVQFYVAVATPMLEIAAMVSPLPGDPEAKTAPGQRFGTPAGSAADRVNLTSSRDITAVLRALVARDASTFTARDIALLSADVGQLLSYHRHGLRLVRRSRGFLTAVRLTTSSAQLKQPLGVLLEGGRQSASGLAASERRAFVRALCAIGESEGPSLDDFAQAAARDASQPLTVLISGLAGEGHKAGPEDLLAGLDAAALAGIVAETRSAARLLRAVLFREAAAADTLAARLNAFDNGCYSLTP